jgi:hypothetical protein
MNWIVGDAIQDLGTLSRNCEGFAAAHYRNWPGAKRFRKIEPDLMGNITLVRS